MLMMASTIDRSDESRPNPSTKERSTFSAVTGSFLSLASDE